MILAVIPRTMGMPLRAPFIAASKRLKSFLKIIFYYMIISFQKISQGCPAEIFFQNIFSKMK